ncbi:hypothetical protein GTA08_BOTSDO13564 [Neofusicoccum parvum]|nr:hypothetical protein GTA08_BOTSDO13564 [Neofusicoccum parvum]
MCLSENENIELDTGFLDSNNNLGLNSPPGDRFLYRRVTKCAPLVTEGYSRPFKYADDGSEGYYMRFYYGQPIYLPEGADRFIYEYPGTSWDRFLSENSSSSFSDYSLGEGGRYWCKNQKILTTAYTNFNTFGLCLTLILGTIIITISYSLEPLVSWIQKRRRLDTYSRLEWCTNETLQLQRLAHEEFGLGTWSGAAGDIPSTEPGEMLAMLDLSKPDHPRLKAPPANFEDLLATGTSEKQVPDHELSNASDTSSNSEGKSQQQITDARSHPGLPGPQLSGERVVLCNEGQDEGVWRGQVSTREHRVGYDGIRDAG